MQVNRISCWNGSRRTGYRLAALRCSAGASSIEYILILAVVVIPIALLSPVLLNAIVHYAARIAWAIRLPVG